ncbi:MAG: hypothetical protein ABEH56_05300 [Salinirussus sp.]
MAYVLSMSRFPKKVREAAVKCISCNAPVVETVGGEYVCVKCANNPVRTE